MIHIRPGTQGDLAQLAAIERETASLFSPSDLPAALAAPLPEAVLT